MCDYEQRNIFVVNDDTGYTFACYSYDTTEPSAYLADLNNDGNPELICNTVGRKGENYTAYTQIFRLNNGIIESGRFIDDFESFAEENNLYKSEDSDKLEYYNSIIPGFDSNHSYFYLNLFYIKYFPDKNKILLKSTYDNKEYEMNFDQFIFSPVNNCSTYSTTSDAAYPIRVDKGYSGPLLGIKNWHIEKEGVTSNIEVCYIINDTTGNLLLCYKGYKDMAAVYLADIDNDRNSELICNYQYVSDQPDIHENVDIYTIDDGVLKHSIYIILSPFDDFENADNIILSNYDYHNDFYARYIPEKNKIKVQKIDDDTEYELSVEHIVF